MNKKTKLQLITRAMTQVISGFKGTAEETYLRLLDIDEHGDIPEDISLHSIYEDLDLDSILSKIDEYYCEFVQVHNEAIELASKSFEGNLEIISEQFQYYADGMEEGVDYEIGFSRSSILENKIK